MATLLPIEPQATSPFLSIWTRPRETIRDIADRDPTKHVLLLAAVSGLLGGISNAISQGLQLGWPIALAIAVAVVLGPIGGIISLYIQGWLYQWTGSWLGGTATAEQVRAAVAWSSLPNILGMLIAGTPLALLTLYVLYNYNSNLSMVLDLALIVAGLITFTLSIWATVILCQGLGEVHRFSGWTGFGTVLVGNMVISIPFFCLAFIGLMLFGGL